MYNLYKSAGSMSAFSNVTNSKSKDDKGNGLQLENRCLFYDADHYATRPNAILTSPRDGYYD